MTEAYQSFVSMLVTPIAALKVRPNKTDRNDAAGLAEIIRTGWFKQVRIKSRISYELRSLLCGTRGSGAVTREDRERDSWSSAHLWNSVWQDGRGIWEPHRS